MDTVLLYDMLLRHIFQFHCLPSESHNTCIQHKYFLDNPDTDNVPVQTTVFEQYCLYLDIQNLLNCNKPD